MSDTAQNAVLLVDDDQFLLDMYKEKFGEAGFQVTAAVTAEEALARLREGLSPRAIVMDMVMPSTDGTGLLEKMRAEKLAPGAAVIVLSNKSDDESKAQAKALGADGYIIKADTVPSQVLEAVAEIIKEKKS